MLRYEREEKKKGRTRNIETSKYLQLLSYKYLKNNVKLNQNKLLKLKLINILLI